MQEITEGLLTLLRNMQNYTAPFMAVCAFLAYIIKPVRNRILKTVKKISNSDEINAHINELNEKMDRLLDRDALHEKINLAVLENRITNLYHKYANSDYMPSFEKKNLVNQFMLYEQLGGNGYVKTMYESLVRKSEKSPDGTGGGGV